LYGHLVFDTVKENPKTNHDIGGIVNVWRSLKDIDPTLDIYVCPSNIGTSIITIDKENSQRTSESKLNGVDVKIQPEPAVISHIAYINEIDDLSFLKDITGLVFADICSGREINKDAYKYLNYIFVSEEDMHLLRDVEEFKGTVITHSPMKSYNNKGKTFTLPEDKYIKGVNVLGAGDYYAACFMYGKLNTRLDFECMKLSHNLTTNHLKSKV
jgi:sugar/nucleoside kinase (ribokinase family)